MNEITNKEPVQRVIEVLDNFDKNLKIVREEIYGTSKIIFGYFKL